ncbi:hypothetical protein DJ60_970 [Yersinia enterocolitica]|nr:hypothetical protein DJ60_970 [Yersinia enterocolitica]
MLPNSVVLQKECRTINTGIKIIQSNYVTKENINKAKKGIITSLIITIIIDEIMSMLPSIIRVITTALR